MTVKINDKNCETPCLCATCLTARDAELTKVRQGKKSPTQSKILWFYMHTIAGIPAQYEEGEQIVFANSTHGNSGIRRLCKSLEQIRLEQKLSNEWRRKQGFEVSDDYGYIRILREIFNLYF